MTSGCLAGSVLRRQCPGTPRHKAAGGGGIWRPVRSEETRPVRLQEPRGEVSESPKFCCCVPPARRPLGCVQMAGRERGHSCKAESWAGMEPLSPQPPPSSRGEMSSGGSDSGSCHCCPWERGRGRDAPLFSPGAAKPPLGGPHPQLAVRGQALELRGEGTARATGLALPQLGLVHQEGTRCHTRATPAGIRVCSQP